MTQLRLRTQLFIATRLIICGLTGALLLLPAHGERGTSTSARTGTESPCGPLKACTQREQQLVSYRGYAGGSPDCESADDYGSTR